MTVTTTGSQHEWPKAPVLVVMGVSGVGKTSVATQLADRLGWPVQEGDDLHPQANVEKMAGGTPLTDEDRWPWLDRVAGWIDARIAAGESGVITCSALKRRYRDVLRRDQVVFVHLQGEPERVRDLLAHRSGHYMPASLLDSQYQTLEALESDEQALVVPLQPTVTAEVDAVVAELGLA